MRQFAEVLDRNSDEIASIYAERAGGSVREWRARMRDETWISDQEAVTWGWRTASPSLRRTAGLRSWKQSETPPRRRLSQR